MLNAREQEILKATHTEAEAGREATHAEGEAGREATHAEGETTRDAIHVEAEATRQAMSAMAQVRSSFLFQIQNTDDPHRLLIVVSHPFLC